MPNTSIQATGEALRRRSTQGYADAWNLCRKLGKELSQALAATGDEEFAHILPTGHDCAVSFGQLQADMRREGETPLQTINWLAGRIALLLGDDPKLGIERVAIDSRGIYSQVKLPDQFQDPLMEAINGYREGMKAFAARPEDEDFRKNEDRYIRETYGPYQDDLVDNVLPTTSLNGVKEAIRFAIDEADHIDPMARNALISALSYLEAM